MVDDKLVRAFLEVAEEGSFRKAAEKLHYSPMALIKQVNALEKKLGARLFERASSKTTLTDAGEILYADLTRISGEIKKAFDRCGERTDDNRKTVIRFGINLISAPFQVTRLFRQFPCLGELFDVRFFLANQEDVGAELEQVYDFLIWPGRAAGIPGLGFYPLATKAPCLFVPSENVQGEKTEIAHLLKGEVRVLTLTRGICTELDRGADILAGQYPSLLLERRYKAFNLTMLNDAVKTGSTLFLPDLGAELHPGLVRVPLTDLPAIPYGLLFSPRESERKKRFLNEVGYSGTADGWLEQ